MSNVTTASSEAEVKQTWNWTSIVFVAGMHIASVYAIVYGVRNGFSAGSWIWSGIFFLLSVVGISIGYHRFMTHGSFKCAWPVKFLFLFCGGTAWQGNAIAWVTDHRTHHQRTDGDGDPHSPKDGFWWAHMEWFLRKHANPEDEQKMCPDLLRDPLVASQKHWWYIPGILGFIVPFFVFGLEGLLLVGVLRLVFTWHAIWAINSVRHMWGKRAFATKDRSTNNKSLAWLIPSGEPCHNNQHADPKCAFLGWRWYDPDMGKWIIQLLELIKVGRFRLVWNVNKPRPDKIRRLYALIADDKIRRLYALIAKK
jgi:stearoyl-CoA desaturase (delta-9 desaturase)